MSNKRQAAIDFINSLRTANPGELQRHIDEVGEDLSEFFLSYASTLIDRDPEHIRQNCTSLMLMGYLVRMNEELRATKAQGFSLQVSLN